MSAANNKWVKWQQIAGIGLICSLAIAGCNRSEKEDRAEVVEANEEQPIVDDAVAPAIDCNDPLVQDRLKTALKGTLSQQAQTIAASYANDAQISISSSDVSEKAGSAVINVQNATVLQGTNTNGMTTCQATVSITLPSEDLYQASQAQAANNRPSLQTRLSQDNIRLNNNILTDDAFTYVVGTQGGQVQARIVGQSALVRAAADVMASSVVTSVMDEQRAERQEQEAKRRREATRSNENKTSRQPQAVTPLEPIRPVEPVSPPTPPKVKQSNNQNSSQNDNQAAATLNSDKPSSENKALNTPETPKLAPNDDSIDMVIIEDDSATY